MWLLKSFPSIKKIGKHREEHLQYTGSRERIPLLRESEMREICGERGFRLLAFFATIAQFFVSAYSDDLSTSNNGTKAEHPRGSKGSKIVILCLVLVAAALISFFVFKFWQKKKREEQYARLLKLFEEDDDLELELGLRD